MYIVKFVRRDGEPDEEYIYNEYGDAKHHMDLFIGDDSQLYSRIDLLRLNDNGEVILCSLTFLG